MEMMERIGRLILSLAGASFLAFAAGVFLSGVDAGIGWFYGVGFLLICLAIFRTLVPSAGISRRWVKPFPHKGHTRVPHPTA